MFSFLFKIGDFADQKVTTPIKYLNLFVELYCTYYREARAYPGIRLIGTLEELMRKRDFSV